MTPAWILTYFLLGGVVGLLAGLFGIGGGGVMVPVLTVMFASQGFPDEHGLHLALGTSMAAIVPTAVSSLLAHHRRGAVLWPVVAQLAPGVVVGTFAATFLASRLPTRPLAVFFVVFMTYVSWKMISSRPPKASRTLPPPVALAGAGAGIGGVSALVAIGGGSLTVPFLAWCNVRLQTAIGTSAAVGLPIAFMGALGYVLNGLGVTGLPAGTLGYVYWPAAVGMALASSLTAPLGARLAHRLPVLALKRMFAVLVLALALHMLYKVTTG
ncbi:MAG TPA: sulfite exporter TauE/SafE family protein [Fibrobacteria bacterium]|nr:sulfite exporter TauE/SafE family protein [Fibrobacteria bacterium]